ncbi:hypothetical protein, partial [Prevotellamassilia timonensis]|uniref:hypothetical protein n=1 Tax=Prevotellamassilia timonensis TaxID=1852370 RepID=UPI00307A688C
LRRLTAANLERRVSRRENIQLLFNVSFLLIIPRDASPPLVLAFFAARFKQLKMQQKRLRF